MRTSHLPSIVLALSALVACASAAQSTAASFEDRTWRLVELNGKPAITTGGERSAHLRFPRGADRVMGSTGCNRLTGSITRQGTSLRFGPTAMTRMACVDGGINVQERAMLAALQATERYEIARDTLTLLGTSEALARFAAGSP
jgi:heat shock protein HslJ